MSYHTSDGVPLTAQQIARLDQIEARVGNTVDFPPAPEANWTTAVRGKHAKANVGDTIPVRVDPEVRDWIRAKGPGYDGEINRMLREKMLAEGSR